ncbi:MAG TPA: hypothetical protein VKR21_01065 [Solirubrobacteraceae bacterium]|nr:hypothetical protein [Solirubrobacteraceae bacterium]
MARNLVEHARRHVIAYMALACGLLSLGGAAYASTKIPNGSVGERQIKNHVIDPVKWDQAYVTGFVRRWATLSSSGAILSTAPNGQAERLGPGQYVVTWGDKFAGWCAPIATVIGGSATRPATGTTGPTGPTGATGPTGPTAGQGAYAEAKIITRSGESTLVAVATYSSSGAPTDEPVSVGVICGPGAGSGQLFPTALP